MSTQKDSVLDPILVSNSIAPIFDWKVYHEGSTGSDHYPTFCKINIHASVTEVDRGGQWVFGKANWGRFKEVSEE